MPINRDPVQYWENMVVPVKGYIEGYALDYTANLADPDDTIDAGMVVHLDSDGNMARGCGDDEMPMWAIYSSDDSSVQGDDGNINSGSLARLTAIVATGGFEVFTTAYDKGETYSPNDMLRPAGGADAGLVTRSATNYNDNLILGVVSQGEKTGTEKAGSMPQYGEDLLYFWTTWIPKVKTS